jgi:hypothetical protein
MIDPTSGLLAGSPTDEVLRLLPLPGQEPATKTSYSQKRPTTR